MKHALRLFLLASCLCSFGQAAVLNFSGTLTSTSGIFSSFPGLNAGDPFYGSVDITSVGADQNASLSVGLYSVLAGRLDLFTPGLGSLAFVLGPSLSISVTTVHQESGDSLTIAATSAFESAGVTFNGNNGFLLNDSFPIGNGGINFTQFTGGTAYYDANLIATSQTSAIVQGNSVDFVINQVSDAPEPGSLLIVPAGALTLYLRRRTQLR